MNNTKTPISYVQFFAKPAHTKTHCVRHGVDGIESTTSNGLTGISIRRAREQGSVRFAYTTRAPLNFGDRNSISKWWREDVVAVVANARIFK